MNPGLERSASGRRPSGPRSAVSSSLAILLLLLVVCAHTQAHPVGTVFSGPTDGDGASLYWNPAAMARVSRGQVDLVANLSILQVGYRRSGIDTQTGAPFPDVGAVAPRLEPLAGVVVDRLLPRRLRLGLTFSVPAALGSAWPETVEVAGQRVLGPTRYYATQGSGFFFYTQVGASVRLHRVISFGLALNVVTARLESNKHLDLLNQGAVRDLLPCTQTPAGCENPAFSARLSIAGTGVGVGGTFGLLIEPVDWLRLGIAYQTPVGLSIRGTAEVDTAKLEALVRDYLPGFGSLGLQGSGVFRVTVPQRVHAAIAFDLGRAVELTCGLRWIQYSASELTTGQITQKGSTLLPDTIVIAQIRSDELTSFVRVAWRIGERWRLGLLVEYTPPTFADELTSPAGVDFHTLVFNLGLRVRLRPWVTLGGTLAQYATVPRTIKRSTFDNTSPTPFNLPDPSGAYRGNAERFGLDLSFSY